MTQAAPTLKVTVDLPEPLPSLPAPLVHLCLRFLPESVTNSIKYAGASSFAFRLTWHGQEIQLCAEDNGCVENLSRARNGFSSLRQRVEDLGGTFHAAVALNQPVRLHACLPVLPGAL
ncbi:sensor histidine kinase [Deinococcus hohokamensis]|uniref:Sensor histidine kinase n=1 Tax=Deinococcus hohokamensis TaxID=309883 RepID=A0ABV9I6D6_9DEIO